MFTKVPLKSQDTFLAIVHWSFCKDIQLLQHLCERDRIASFASLPKKCSLPSKAMFTYVCITDILQKMKPLQHSILKSLLSNFNGLPRDTKSLAKWYQILNNHHKFTKTDSVVEWEQKLQQNFPPVCLQMEHQPGFWAPPPVWHTGRPVSNWSFTCTILRKPDSYVSPNFLWFLHGLWSTGHTSPHMVSMTTCQAIFGHTCFSF